MEHQILNLPAIKENKWKTKRAKQNVCASDGAENAAELW